MRHVPFERCRLTHSHCSHVALTVNPRYHRYASFAKPCFLPEIWAFFFFCACSSTSALQAVGWFVDNAQSWPQAAIRREAACLKDACSKCSVHTCPENALKTRTTPACPACRNWKMRHFTWWTHHTSITHKTQVTTMEALRMWTPLKPGLYSSVFPTSCWCTAGKLLHATPLPCADAMWRVQISSSVSLHSSMHKQRDRCTLPNKQHDVSPCSHKVTQPCMDHTVEWHTVSRKQDKHVLCVAVVAIGAAGPAAFLSEQLVNSIHLSFQV